MMETSNFNNLFQQYVYINTKNILITEIFIEKTLNDKRLLGTYTANKVVFSCICFVYGLPPFI